MGIKISGDIETIKNGSDNFKDTQPKQWEGKSGSNVKSTCISPVIPKVSSALSAAKAVETIDDKVSKMNELIKKVDEIDKSISQYSSQLSSYYGLSALKKSQVAGLDRFYKKQISDLQEQRKGYMETIKGYKQIISSNISKL